MDVSAAELPTNPIKESEFPAPGLKVTFRVLLAESALRVLSNVIAPVNTRLLAAMITGDPKIRGPVWLVVIVRIVGELKTGVVFEKSVPVTGVVPDVNVMLWTLFPNCPIFPVVIPPVFALRMMFRPGPVKLVRVIFPLLLFTVKSVPALSAMVPFTKVIAPPPDVIVVKAPAVKLKFVPAV